jgi:antirestriction protein ArdC
MTKRAPKKTAKELKAESKSAVARLLESLANHAENALASPQFQAWAKVQSSFHHYSFYNTCWLMSQAKHRGIDITAVNSFKRWQKVGRFVMRGQKALHVLAPMRLTRKDSEGNAIMRDDDTPATFLWFKPVPVFDISQTDGDELPSEPDWKTVVGDGEPLVAGLEKVAEALGVTLEYRDDLDSEGESHGGRCTVKSGLPAAQTARTLAHELAHELLHWGKDRSDFTRDEKELEADATAYVVCLRYGLDSTEATANYVACWGSDKEAILAKLGRVQKAAKQILDELDKVMGGNDDIDKAA